MADRAAIVSRVFLQIVADHVRTDGTDSLRQQIEALVRTEFAEVVRTTLNEIRREDE